MRIDISNHPVKTNITRKVEYGGLTEVNKEWFSTPLQVILAFKVFYYLNEDPIFENDLDHVVALRATKDTMVDFEGNILTDLEGKQEGVDYISEFDFFQIVKDNPVIINTMIRNKALQGDLEGRFDFDI